MSVEKGVADGGGVTSGTVEDTGKVRVEASFRKETDLDAEGVEVSVAVNFATELNFLLNQEPLAGAGVEVSRRFTSSLEISCCGSLCKNGAEVEDGVTKGLSKGSTMSVSTSLELNRVFGALAPVSGASSTCKVLNAAIMVSSKSLRVSSM